MVNIRHPNKVGAVKEFMTVITQCNELYWQLVAKGVIQKPGIQRQMWANSLEFYINSQRKPDLWDMYRETTLDIAGKILET
jgi:hypothetical protein